MAAYHDLHFADSHCAQADQPSDQTLRRIVAYSVFVAISQKLNQLFTQSVVVRMLQ